MKSKNYIFIFSIIGLIITQSLGQNYLSNLTATKNDPLFTTYAAPLPRSEFIVDEGYQFGFYDNNDGINFVTDNAGHISLAFKLNGEVRYRLDQMYSEPVITTSYCDLVKYHYQPFADINVDVFFQVYSSRIAIQDITITNTDSQSIQLGVYPFLQHHVEINNVNISSDHRYFSFIHNENPDSWTVGHGVPYEDVIANIYILNEAPDAFGSYQELGLLPYPLKSSTFNVNNYCVEWGLVHHADSSLCYHTPTQAQQVVFHNGSIGEILTENAPKWGDPDPNIPGNGYQGCELGNFINPPIATGDSFSVVFTCLATGQQGIATGQIPTLPAPSGVRTDVQLTQNVFPPVPQNVDIRFFNNNTSALITWDQVPGYFYSVFRRTASTPGRYDLISDSINASGYLNIGLNPDSTYGYIVIACDNFGGFSGHSIEVDNAAVKPFFSDITHPLLWNSLTPEQTKIVAFQKNIFLENGQSESIRIVRGVVEDSGNSDSLRVECENLMLYDMQQAVSDNEFLYNQIPRLNFTNPDYEMTYWNAFSLIRQCMLPPEGQCSHNYYVFSREPTWGWGHGGQVFHESITMLAYVFMDPISAMNSQRVYMERQWPDGYINYRTGPYLNETIPYSGQYTTSAPWFSWENWELYQVSQDTSFLSEAYQSGKLFYNYWLISRDADNDGLCEWGAHAVLECVRDGQAVIWDQVGWPANFEGLDLNCMLVSEAQSLAEMAQELGLNDEYQNWMQEAAVRTDSINKYMWDDQTGFYFHVDKTDHDFSFASQDDLKRMEIIGFLPMWAGVANQQQAARLVQHLTDPNKFWRNFGIPTLAADDSYYNHMGYWNGPVWVQWQYLIFRGLLSYGYVNEAQQLMEKVLDNVIQQLKTNHWFWELYSPDYYQAGWHKSYIWTGVVARMFIDLEQVQTRIKENENKILPSKFELKQNYPNPFNSQTIIEFEIPGQKRVSLKVYNILGELICTLKDEEMSPGSHRIIWDGKNEQGVQVSSGLFFVIISTKEFHQINRMILLR